MECAKIYKFLGNKYVNGEKRRVYEFNDFVIGYDGTWRDERNPHFEVSYNLNNGEKRRKEYTFLKKELNNYMLDEGTLLAILEKNDISIEEFDKIKPQIMKECKGEYLINQYMNVKKVGTRPRIDNIGEYQTALVVQKWKNFYHFTDLVYGIVFDDGMFSVENKITREDDYDYLPINHYDEDIFVIPFPIHLNEKITKFTTYKDLVLKEYSGRYVLDSNKKFVKFDDEYQKKFFKSL